MSSLRLGLYYHIPAHPKDGKIYLPGFFGRFVDSLAGHCLGLTCFFHLASGDEAALCDYPLQSTNIHWVNLGLAHSAPYRTLFSGHFTRLIMPHLTGLDALLLRGPSPLLPAIADAAKKMPVALFLVGDYLAGIDSAAQPPLRKALIRIWAHWNTRGQLHAARRSLTIVNSHQLFQDLRPQVRQLAEVRTTTLNQDDFFERFDTCQASSIRLLYTGRLSAAKGLFDMVDAIAILLAQGKDVSLELVGWPEKAEKNIVQELLAYAEKKGIADRISYLGYKAVGEALLACYRRADIYLIASQSSFEGFPRTIWEAMANSLPVVATSVGSIPAYVDGLAEIVAPQNPVALAAGIASMIDSPALRQRYIQQGLALARQNTLEARTPELLAQIENWLQTLD